MIKVFFLCLLFLFAFYRLRVKTANPIEMLAHLFFFTTLLLSVIFFYYSLKMSYISKTTPKINFILYAYVYTYYCFMFKSFNILTVHRYSPRNKLNVRLKLFYRFLRRYILINNSFSSLTFK